MPSKKLKVSIRTPKEIFGSEIYTIFIDVTNITSKMLNEVAVEPQFLPGTLKRREEPTTSELSELQQKKQKIVREMESQVAEAYENKALRGKTGLRLLTTIMLNVFKSVEVAFSGLTPIFYFKRKGIMIPDYAKEALSIEDWEDVERLEKDIISSEEQGSDIKMLFLLNKEKLSKLQSKIAVSEVEKNKASLKDMYSILPGETMTFPFEAIAPRLLRARSYSLQFKISYKDSGSDIVGTISEGETISLYPSFFSTYAGAFLGAGAGFLTKSVIAGSLQQTWFMPLSFWFNLVISIVLALISIVLTTRTPDKKKWITTEDFFGGLILGFLVGIASKSIYDNLVKLVPTT